MAQQLIHFQPTETKTFCHGKFRFYQLYLNGPTHNIAFQWKIKQKANCRISYNNPIKFDMTFHAGISGF